MFYLGIIDITAVFDSAIISGYLSLVGAVFCTHPALTYIGGGLGLGKSVCLTSGLAKRGSPIPRIPGEIENLRRGQGVFSFENF